MKSLYLYEMICVDDSYGTIILYNPCIYAVRILKHEGKRNRINVYVCLYVRVFVLDKDQRDFKDKRRKDKWRQNGIKTKTIIFSVVDDAITGRRVGLKISF